MAACADSCITSPSLPVGVRRPLPSMMVASTASTEPPTSVQARPVAKPISFCFSSHIFAVLENAEVVLHIFRGDFDGRFRDLR